MLKPVTTDIEALKILDERKKERSESAKVADLARQLKALQAVVQRLAADAPAPFAVLERAHGATNGNGKAATGAEGED